jgi:hypothetical protein
MQISDVCDKAVELGKRYAGAITSNKPATEALEQRLSTMSNMRKVAEDVTKGGTSTLDKKTAKSIVKGSKKIDPELNKNLRKAKDDEISKVIANYYRDNTESFEGSRLRFDKALDKMHGKGQAATQTATNTATQEGETAAKQAASGKAAQDGLDIDEGIENLQEQAGSSTAQTATGSTAQGQVNQGETMSERFGSYRDAMGYGNTIGGNVQAGLDLSKQYLLGGDIKRNAARIGTVAAGVEAANMGARYLSGGTATRNNKGEHDIAGIPFF